MTRTVRLRRMANARLNRAAILLALGLSSSHIAETAPSNSLVGSILGAQSDSQLSLTDDAGGRFLLDGADIRNAAILDFEAAPSHQLIVRETNSAFPNSPRESILTVSVTNVFEAPLLETLSLAQDTLTLGQTTSIAINGTKPGSTITGTVPAGMVLNGVTRTITGAPTQLGPHIITLTETLTDSANSPRESNLAIDVIEASGQQVILAVIAGQSNSVGRNLQDGADTDQSNILQYGGQDGEPATYQQLVGDITPLHHPDDTFDRVGPGLQILSAAAAANPDAVIVAVPVAVGSTGVINGGWRSSATPGSGGTRFEFMVDQANAARAAALAAYPGANIEVQFYWVQGEQDAAEGQSYDDYKAALSDLINHSRDRITGAANAPFIIGSMVPRKFSPEAASGYVASYVPINAAHVDLSLEKANVHYVLGPDELVARTNAINGGTADNLHYQPAAVAREFGDRLGAYNIDNTGPVITTASAQGAQLGAQLAINLAHDDLFGHASLAITGGSAASSFELSHAWDNPVLRWTGDGNGPAAPGDYSVAVIAKDGFGNAGLPKTFTITVSQPYGTGDQGPVAVTGVEVRGPENSAYGEYTIPNVAIKTGLNLFFLQAGGGSNRDSGLEVRVAGNPATKFFGAATGNNFQIWGYISTVDTDADVLFDWPVNTMGNIYFGHAVMTGTKAVPSTTDYLPWASRAAPHETSSLNIPDGGIAVAFGVLNDGNPAIASPATLQVQGADSKAVVVSSTQSGTIAFTAPSGGFSAIGALVFEKSEP